MARRAPNDVLLAQRMIAQEVPEGATLAEAEAGLARVHELLNARLSPLIGVAGVRALLGRSARLARAEFPSLETLARALDAPAPPLPATDDLRPGFAAPDSTTAVEAATALYATFRGLLRSFIGERLVTQVIRSAFPAIPQSVPKETES